MRSNLIIKKVSILLVFLLVVQTVVSSQGMRTEASLGTKTILDEYRVSPGVTYQHEQFRNGTSRFTMNVLDVNLNDPYTKMHFGLPIPLNSTARTTFQAQRESSPGHRVVGATNAVFYNMSHPDRMPFSLIAQNNRIINYGTVSSSWDQSRNQPIVFGIRENGKAWIDHYNATSTLSFSNRTLSIDNINAERGQQELIIYTPSNIRPRTGTNTFGTEIVVRNASIDTSNLKFGDKMTGTVTRVIRYGETANSTIPSDGFVISAHGGENLSQLSGLKVGDQVEVSVSINQPWRNAQMILGSGPLLVKDGKVNISMNEKVFFASSRQPRTAVAINKTGDRVFMVTVDGRQPGYSDGMTLREFANYLISLGADRALNFDGGGSTTMVVRKPGDVASTLANRPSDGIERSVSATLQVVSTAPRGEPTHLTLRKSPEAVVKRSRLPIQLAFAQDQFYHPITIDQKDITWSADETVGRMEGNTFVATKAGRGTIRARHGNGIGRLGITVVDTFDRLVVQPGSLSVTANQSVRLSANAVNNNGNPLIFDSRLVEWRVSNGVGTVAANGTFKASSRGGTGTITASYNGIRTTIPVTVKGGSNDKQFTIFSDVSTNHGSYNQIIHLSNRNVIRGFSDGTFRPGESITRAQAATMLVRELNLDMRNRPAPSFKDVSKSHHAYDVIAAVADEGLIRGNSSGEFNPGDTLTRAQMAVILERAYSIRGNVTKQTFTDVSPNTFGYSAIERLVQNNVAEGFSDGTFRPGEPVTRAQFATFLYRVEKNNLK